MPFHAFDTATYDATSDTLEVIGTSTRPLDDSAEIYVAVIDVNDDDRRSQTQVSTRVALASWPATFENTIFRDGDIIFAAGMSKDDHSPVFVWAEQLTIAKK